MVKKGGKKVKVDETLRVGQRYYEQRDHGQGGMGIGRAGQGRQSRERMKAEKERLDRGEAVRQAKRERG